MTLFTACQILTLTLASTSFAAEVLTHHNDSKRSGTNLQETILTPASVSPTTFGKLFEVPVDGLIYAQPLVVEGLAMKGKTRTVVYTATAHNTLYAIDGVDGSVLWRRNFGPSMPTPNAFLPAVDNNMPYYDLTPEHGTVSTPVIDKETSTIYLTSFTQINERVAPFVSFHHKLHALDLVTGADKFASPQEIRACIFSPETLAKTAGHTHGGRHILNPELCLDPMQHMQRSAVTLVKRPGQLPQILLGFGSHGDYPLFHGWLLSYQATDLRRQLGVWVSNTDNQPQGTGAAIWQSGMGFPIDDDGNFFLMTGNGFSTEVAFGNSLLRFSTNGNTIQRTDRYSPCPAEQQLMNVQDLDFGSSGPMLLDDPALTPRPALVTGGGKEGRLYLWNKDQLGGISTCDEKGFDTKVPQEFQAIKETSVHHFPHIHCAPVYWRSAGRRHSPR